MSEATVYAYVHLASLLICRILIIAITKQIMSFDARR